MRRFGRSALAVVLFTLIASCSGHKADAVKKFESIADAVCACKDQECLRAEADKAKAWLEKNGDRAKTANAAEKERFKQARARLEECVMKLTSEPLQPKLPPE